MKAIVLEHSGSVEELKLKDIPMPIIEDNKVIIKICGFGINRSEVLLRQYEVDESYINSPIVPGIECVGIITETRSNEFNVGDKVIALMGGMGRSFNGSYEEYMLISEKNVFKLNDNITQNLPLEEIAAIPETYLTAYGSLFECLQLNVNDTLLIRGGTSATGLTALTIAKAVGCTIITTTRKKERVPKLLSLGADYVLIDEGNLSDKILDIYPNGVNKVLELIGPSTLKDSFKCLSNKGICCITGILGDKEIIDNFDPIKDIPNGKYLTSFFSNYPTQETIDEIFDFIINYDIKTNISEVFESLKDVKKAHEIMENNKAEGKLIVKISEL